MRQLADPSVNITLTRSYEPFGDPLSTTGSGTSIYTFIGEQRDGTGLVYLRARYFAPAFGRFLSRDPYGGDVFWPLSLNGWGYSEGNPTNFTDPTGLITSEEAAYADAFVEALWITYRVRVVVDWGYVPEAVPVPQPGDAVRSGCWQQGEWSLDELHTLWLGVVDLAIAMRGQSAFVRNAGGITVSQEDIGRSGGLTWPHRIKYTSSSSSFGRWTVVHELSHAWDANFGWSLSAGLEELTGGHTSLIGRNIVRHRLDRCDPPNFRLPGCNAAGYFYEGPPAAGSDVNFNRFEDFAESATAYVYPEEAFGRMWRIVQKDFRNYGPVLYYRDYTETQRWAYIHGLIMGGLEE
ncbi:MAG: RHS repeat-associated core domain-containing protein [Candidatus Bipolaricaulota bacterium]